MNIKKWIENNTHTLGGKTVAITGSTGGLGREICKHLALLGADLILLDRNEQASYAHRSSLVSHNPDIKVKCVKVDLVDERSVIGATETLKTLDIDVFIHNAGAYSIPRYTTTLGYDNVFMINFISPYYMIRELLPQIRERNGKVLAVGSIAHKFSNVDKNDVDFSTRRAASSVYGNAKRYLMFSLLEMFKEEFGADLCIVHPGITPTNITAHYPKLLHTMIKPLMKLVFMSPQKAALSIILGVFDTCSDSEWIGPRCFDIWGFPKKCRRDSCGKDEREFIGSTAENIYELLKNTYADTIG